MVLEVQKSFERDAEKVSDKKLATRLRADIDELEQCRSLAEVRNVKRMQSHGKYFRIRVGNYRRGLRQQKHSLLLLRFMPRKEIYKYFP